MIEKKIKDNDIIVQLASEIAEKLMCDFTYEDHNTCIIMIAENIKKRREAKLEELQNRRDDVTKEIDLIEELNSQLLPSP